MAVTKVLSVGGSIVVPETPDTDFLKKFVAMTSEWLSKDSSRRLILVVGGGGPARIYQGAYREIVSAADNSEADWIGIMATRLNAQLLKASFGALCPNPVVYNPTEDVEFKGQVLVAAGWKPGFSTDTDAVYLAEKFSADTVVNLSNIEKVYTDDPRKNPDATPIDNITWTDFRKMVGDEWVPGKNCPFDPIASKKAQELKLKVICAGGKNIPNIQSILNDSDYVGTTIVG
ncbi:MAG: UMP kinase [Treponema sp.]|uniref:UMP kinase n=1 Tax=Treponema sp. TaxID=166 RepID=UPI00298E600B|nr:UMP kinase [Treponema sp.]MCQ2601194.1 UMP kinase [Treponema sp.]